MIDKKPAYTLRRHCEKISAVLPVHPLVIDELNVQIVHQRRRLKRMAGIFGSHVPPSQTLELLVDERRQTIQRILISVVPGQQQCRDIGSFIPIHARCL